MLFMSVFSVGCQKCCFLQSAACRLENKHSSGYFTGYFKSFLLAVLATLSQWVG